jgi:hypothetical protein
MAADQPKGPGRPRKWANEAERKRAYRQRMADELADPLATRAAARAARQAAITARREATEARADARRWQRKAEASARRAEEASLRARQAVRDVRQAHQERDRALALLRRKLQWAGRPDELRRDPDKLVALVAELTEVREQYRLRAERAERILFRHLPYDLIAEEYERP